MPLYGSTSVNNQDLLQVPITAPTVVDQNGELVGQISPNEWNSFIQTLSRVTNNSSAFSSGTGVNYIPQNYSQFTAGSLPPLTSTSTLLYDVGFTIFGNASLKVTGAGTTYFSATSTAYDFVIAPSLSWIISVYCKASVANSTGTLGVKTANGTYTVPFTTNAVAGDISRIYGILNLGTDTATACTVVLTNANSGSVWFDGFMLEPQSGSSSTPSPYSTNTPPNILNTNPPGGVVNNLPHANTSTQTLQVISNSGGNGQLNVSPTGGVTNTLPYSNHDTAFKDRILTDATLKVDGTTGPVSGTLPYSNHATQVTTTITSAPDSNGSNLAHGIVFDPHISAGQIRWRHFFGDTSGDDVTNLADGLNKRFLHGAMSGPVQGTVNLNADTFGSYLGHGTVFQPHISAGQIGFGHFKGDTSGNYSTAFIDGANLRLLHGAMSGATQNTVAGTADSNGSYLQHGVVFNPHLTGGVVGWKNLLGDTSGDTTTNLIDAANKRFLHGAMSTGVQGVISSGSQVNVNPAGGVTGNLPQDNHDPTVLLSSVTGTQRNLIPDSGLKNVGAYWTAVNGQISVTQNIDGSTNCFQYTGTGAPSGSRLMVSKIITVTPGVYTLSAIGWVTNITSGAMTVNIYDPARTTDYGYVTLTNSRSSNQITIPSGVSQVVALFTTNNATVANGAGSGVQNMQFEPGAVMTAYRENTGDNLSGTLLIDTGNSNHVGNWQHSYMSTGVKGVISSGSQLTVNPSGGVSGTLPYTNHDISFRNVISSGSQLNVNPTGGVVSTLPYANHDISVRNTLASTAGGDGSYLNTGQLFNRHLNNATLTGLADDGTYAKTRGSAMQGGYIKKVSQDGTNLFPAKGTGDTQTLNLDSEIADASFHSRQPRSAAADNLADNGDFEDWLNGVAVGWQNNGTGTGVAAGATMSRDTLPYSGTYCAKVSVTAGSAYGGISALKYFPVTPGQFVSIGVALKSDGTNAVSGGAWFSDSTGLFEGNVFVPATNSAAWAYQTAQGQVPAGATRMYLVTQGPASPSGAFNYWMDTFSASLGSQTTVSPNGAKAFADFTNNAAGGHVGKTQSNIADDSNAKMLRFGTLAGRPAAGTAGRIYHASDAGTNGITYRDTGSAWVGMAVGHLADISGTLDNTNDGSSRFAVAAVDPNKKALIDFSQPGHNNANIQYFGGIQSGTCYDGQAITFNPAYASIPFVIFSGGGMSYSSVTGSAATQSQAFTVSSLTTSGFTASLKLVSGGTLTARSDNFMTVTSGSEYQATLTNAPAYNNTYTVNWTLSLNSSSSGTVYIRETNGSGTILFQKNYLNGQNGAKSTSVTWSGATGSSVIDISLVLTEGTGTISASTVTFTSGTAPSSVSAVPSTAPITWAAFPQT